MPNDYEGNSITRLLHAWSTTHTHGILHHGCHYITHGMPITYIHHFLHNYIHATHNRAIHQVQQTMATNNKAFLIGYRQVSRISDQSLLYA